MGFWSWVSNLFQDDPYPMSDLPQPSSLPKPKLLATIEGCDWVQYVDLTIKASLIRGRVDTDGSGDHHGDKTAQDETTYKPDLNADNERFIVVPGVVRHESLGIVIGAYAVVEDTVTGKVLDGVVGDVGPNDRSGEFSRRMVMELGLSGNPNTGGTDSRRFNVTIYANRPAVVNGKTYKLQAA